MSGLFWLTQAQFERIKPFLLLAHGVPRIDDLRVISGIIYVIRNGLQWKDAPREYGTYGTLYHRFLRWSRMGIFNRIFEELAADGITLDWVLIESTHIKSHGTLVRLLKKGMFPTASSARRRGSPKSEINCERKGFASVTLEPELQDALKEIAEIEGCSVRGLCTAVYDVKKPTSSFAATLRVFIVEYYRSKSKSVVNKRVAQVLKRIRANRSRR